MREAHCPLRAVLTAALLTFALGGGAVLASKLTASAAVALLSNSASFLAVGLLTPRLQHGAGALSAAIGAGGAIVLFGSAQVALFAELREQLGWRVILGSVAMSTAFGATLAAGGALIATSRNRRAKNTDPASWRQVAASEDVTAPPAAPPTP